MASKTIVFFSLYAQSNIYVFVQLKSVQGAFLPVINKPPKSSKAILARKKRELTLFREWRFLKLKLNLIN